MGKINSDNYTLTGHLKIAQFGAALNQACYDNIDLKINL